MTANKFSRRCVKETRENEKVLTKILAANDVAHVLSSSPSELQQLVQMQRLSNADRGEVDAILAQPAARKYYVSFISSLKSFLAACEVIHSRMVDRKFSVGVEAQDFVQNAMRRDRGGFRGAAKRVRWGHTLAEGVASTRRAQCAREKRPKINVNDTFRETNI